jgi:hypothetical protein
MGVKLLLCKNLRIKIYKTIILPAILCGCEIWLLTLREEHKLRVLRRIFGPQRKWQEPGEDCIVRSFITCILHQIFLG